MTEFFVDFFSGFIGGTALVAAYAYAGIAAVRYGQNTATEFPGAIPWVY